MPEYEPIIYELSGGSTAEVHKPFGDAYYFAIVNLQGRYPEVESVAHNIGRREYLKLITGNAELTINNTSRILESKSYGLVDDGDYYFIEGQGKLMVFVEDQENGTTEIKKLLN